MQIEAQVTSKHDSEVVVVSEQVGRNSFGD